MLPILMLPARAIRGRLGDHVYKTYGDKIIITRAPCFDGYVATAAQRARRERMRAATAYAQAVYADPVAKGIYVAVAKQLGRKPFRLAVSDFLHDRPRVIFASANTKTRRSWRSPAATRATQALSPRSVGRRPPFNANALRIRRAGKRRTACVAQCVSFNQHDDRGVELAFKRMSFRTCDLADSHAVDGVP